MLPPARGVDPRVPLGGALRGCPQAHHRNPAKPRRTTGHVAKRVGEPAMRRSRRSESSPSARAVAAGASGRPQSPRAARRWAQRTAWGFSRREDSVAERSCSICSSSVAGLSSYTSTRADEQASDGGRAPDPQEVEERHAQFVHPERLSFGVLQVVTAVAQADRFCPWHPTGVGYVKCFRARPVVRARALLVEVAVAQTLLLFFWQVLITGVPAHDTLAHVPPPP